MESFKRCHGSCCLELPYQEEGKSSGLGAALFFCPFKAGPATMELAVFFIRVKYGSSVTFSCSNQRQRPGTRIHGLGNRVHQVILLLSSALRGHGDRRWSVGWPGRCLQPWTLSHKLGFSRNDAFKSWSPSEAIVQILQTFSEFPVAS